MDPESHFCLTTDSIMNSLADDKILTLIKLKAFADDKFDIAELMTSVFDRVENTVGNRRKCWFSPFPTMFQKTSFSGLRRTEVVWERVNSFPNKPLFLRV